MSTRRSRARAGRAQRAVAIILLLCLALSGLAFYVAASSGPGAPQQTQQRR